MDMSGKKTVNIRYPLGFERIIKSAVLQFRENGLEPVIYRASFAIGSRTSMYKVGFHGASANKQFEYDHRNDLALIFDKGYADRQLSEYKLAYESMKDAAAEFAGPALIEVLVRNLLHLLKKTACQNTVINTKSSLSLSVLKKVCSQTIIYHRIR